MQLRQVRLSDECWIVCKNIHITVVSLFLFQVESIQTFEPQGDPNALSAFLIIAIVFGLLQFRINSVR
jgi:hypothetical protein